VVPRTNTRVAQPGGRPISAVALNFTGDMFQFTLARVLWVLPPVISDVSVFSVRFLWGLPPIMSGTTVGQHWMGKIHFPSKNHNGTTVGQHWMGKIHFPSKNQKGTTVGQHWMGKIHFSVEESKRDNISRRIKKGQHFSKNQKGTTLGHHGQSTGEGGLYRRLKP